jgi:hypothetical protein
MGDIADVNKAIQYFQESVDRTPSDHPERTRRLLNLGIGYHARYQRARSPADIGIAIQCYQESVDQTPLGHPGRAARLVSLEAGYNDRHNEQETLGI